MPSQIIKELQRHRFGRGAETLPEDQILLRLEDVEQVAQGPGLFIAPAIAALVLQADWLPGPSYLQARFSWFCS